jgi:hypothetical protein
MSFYSRAVVFFFVSLTYGASAATPGPISITLPVALISTGFPKGILRGTLTATSGLSSFSASDGTLSCGGSYDAHYLSTTISIPIHCSDGRNGFILVTRERNGANGGGAFTLSDGSPGDFIFGAQARKL